MPIEHQYLKRPIKGILINPFERELQAIAISRDPGLEPIYAVMRKVDSRFSGLVEMVPMGSGVVLWIDEEGLCREGNPCFSLRSLGGENRTFAGAAVLLGISEKCKNKNVGVTLDQVRAIVGFPELETSGEFEPTRAETRPLTLKNPFHMVITMGQPRFQPRRDKE